MRILLLLSACLFFTVCLDARNNLVFSFQDGDDCDLYMKKGTSKPQLLMHTPDHEEWSPRISQDGESVYFASGSVNETVQRLCRYNVSKRNFFPVMSAAFASIGSLDLSPDGTKIVFSAVKSSGMMHSLFLVNADGSDLKEIASGALDHVFPAFSPDGKEVIYITNYRGITDVDIRKIELRTLQTYMIIHDTHQKFRPSFSPDGKSILFSRIVRPSKDKADPMEIVLINADGSNEKVLYRDKIHYSHPQFSSDGKKICFVKGNYLSMQCDLFSLEINSGKTALFVSCNDLSSSGNERYISYPDWN